jgi:hypothetical protein
MLRQVVQAAHPVGRQRHVDLLWVGQVQVVHDLQEEKIRFDAATQGVNVTLF